VWEYIEIVRVSGALVLTMFVYYRKITDFKDHIKSHEDKMNKRKNFIGIGSNCLPKSFILNNLMRLRFKPDFSVKKGQHFS
jgi:hypothetical protein